LTVTETSGSLPEKMTARASTVYPYGLLPYDLEAPARVLIPRFRCAGTPHDERVLTLGSGDDAPRIVRHYYAACRNGCCAAETTVVLSVPCDNMPHCGTCECGDGHEHRLSDDEIRLLKALLP
jgi:hypothetical protein